MTQNWWKHIPSSDCYLSPPLSLSWVILEFALSKWVIKNGTVIERSKLGRGYNTAAVRFLVWVTKRVCLSLEIGFVIVVVTLGFFEARYYIRVPYCSVQVTILDCKYFSLLVAQNTPLRNSDMLWCPSQLYHRWSRCVHHLPGLNFSPLYCCLSNGSLGFVYFVWGFCFVSSMKTSLLGVPCIC